MFLFSVPSFISTGMRLKKQTNKQNIISSFLPFNKKTKAKKKWMEFRRIVETSNRPTVWICLDDFRPVVICAITVSSGYVLHPPSAIVPPHNTIDRFPPRCLSKVILIFFSPMPKAKAKYFSYALCSATHQPWQFVR